MILMSYILLSIYCTFMGFLIGRFSHKTKILDVIKGKIEERPPTSPASFYIPLSPNDTINHEGVGIIHRPTVEEIRKMNEPETIKQAKEAIAQTLRNQSEIDKQEL